MKEFKILAKKDIKEHYKGMFLLFGVPAILSLIVSLISDYVNFGTIIPTDMKAVELSTPKTFGSLGLSILSLLIALMTISALWKYLDIVKGKSDFSEININSYTKFFKNLGHNLLYLLGMVLIVLATYFLVITPIVIIGLFLADVASKYPLTIIVGILLILLLIVVLIWVVLPINVLQYIMYAKSDLSFSQGLRYAFGVMKGRRLNYIGLILSFAGWLLLSIIPVIGWILLIFYVMPYFSATVVRYVNNLMEIYDKKPKKDANVDGKKAVVKPKGKDIEPKVDEALVKKGDITEPKDDEPLVKKEDDIK